MSNKKVIELRNAYREIYKSKITIKNKKFQPIIVEYSISEHVGNKLLKYKYDGYPKEFNEYDIELYESNIDGFNIPKYFDAGLDFIYMQIELINNDSELYNDIDEESINFLKFFESKIKGDDNV